MSTITSNARPAGETSEARIAKALAHPLRARILQRLGERVMSPGDLSVELDAPLGVVSYHVRMLKGYECVELVRTEPRRGALQHFYRAIARPTFPAEAWTTLPSALRGELASEGLTALLRDLGEAAEAERLNDPSTVIARLPLELDERGAKKLAKLLDKVATQVTEIGAESRERLEATGAEAFIATEVGLLRFNRA